MRAERQTSAEQQRDQLNAAIEVAESAGCQDCSGGNSNERVNHVPRAIDDGNFVGEEFNHIENTRHADDPPARQHLELAWKLQFRKPAKQTKRGHSRIEIDSRHPRRAHRDGDCGDQLSHGRRIIAVALFDGHPYNAVMLLLENTPRFELDAAAEIAAESFGIRATARPLPSERDQNFLLTDSAGEKFVLKIANALESREFLEAQNAALNHAGQRVNFCQSLVASVSGDEIVTVKETYFVRVARYLPGVPLAEIRPQSSELLRDLGRKLGKLGQALKDFDHPAVHRDFHWDLSNGNRVIDEYAPLIEDTKLREVVLRCRVDFDPRLRRSVIHGDANDYNVLVDPERMTISGLLDFGDMVYSYTVADLAIAVAYVVLDKPHPRAAAAEIVKGYTSEFELLDEELEAMWPLALLRLAVSACMAAYQQRQQPENEYLRISQRAIEQNLPRIYTDDTD